MSRGMPPGEVELGAVAVNLIADQFPSYKRVALRRDLEEAIRNVLEPAGPTVDII